MRVRALERRRTRWKQGPEPINMMTFIIVFNNSFQDSLMKKHSLEKRTSYEMAAKKVEAQTVSEKGKTLESDESIDEIEVDMDDLDEVLSLISKEIFQLQRSVDESSERQDSIQEIELILDDEEGDDSTLLENLVCFVTF